MTREWLIWLLAVLGLAFGAWWLSVNTEWVDEDSPRSARGEARDNPVYAFEQMLRRLGMHAEHHEALDALPPPKARLVLLSNDWELVPERAEQLHQWVLQGGHLVLMQGTEWDDTALAPWVPVEASEAKPAERLKAHPSPTSPAAAQAAASAVADITRTELASTPPLWDGTERVGACHRFLSHLTLRAEQGHAAAWALARVDGAPATPDKSGRSGHAAKETLHALRVPLGQGSVTVLNTSGSLFFNTATLRCDNPLLLAAAVQAEPGATAWIYLHEKREALLPWLWHRGWIAVVIGALALAAALWRAAVRFGPRLAPAPRLRRSISEQVRGLGAYLHHGGPDALLAAQQRALHEVAGRKLPSYARMSVHERARAISAATGLEADELSTALTARFCTRAELPQRLQVLETARRRLHKTPEERHPS